MTDRIVRWNPFRELAAMQSAMDRIFEDTWRAYEGDNARALALDVHETDDAFFVETALPGVNPDDINITVNNGTLTITGEVKRSTDSEDENARVVMSERIYGTFSRSLNLPQSVDGDNVDATYNNGILKLTLPKTPNAKPRQIKVKSNGLLQSAN